jgi:hypothetical protein
MNRKNVTLRSRLAPVSTLVLGAALLSPLGGCSEPPDNSPVVTIVAPTNGQKLPAGQQIDVRFTVGGVDNTNEMMIPFGLGGGDVKMVGRGHVRAYFDSTNFHARAIAVPNDNQKFMVPDETIVSASSLITPGMKKLTLKLFYNDNTPVSPSRDGVVTVEITP